jgi:hypothetical protein
MRVKRPTLVDFGVLQERTRVRSSIMCFVFGGYVFKFWCLLNLFCLETNNSNEN